MAQQKQKIVSRKHVARLEREKQQQRIITIVSIAILAVVLLLVGMGIADAYLLTPNKTIAQVNSETIKAGEYQAQVRLERFFLVNQYYNYQQFAASFGDQDTQSLFANSMQQIITQLTPDLLGQEVLDQMIEDIVIAEKAVELGISVSDEEVETRIAEQYFNYAPNGTATPVPTSQPMPTSTLTALQMTLTAPTPTAVPDPAVEATEVVEVPTATPIVVPTEAEPTEEPPTPTPYTEDAFRSAYKDGVANLSQIGVNENNFRSITERELLREKVYEALTADTPHSEEQVWARHILVADEEAAKEVLNRLYAGEDFATLAQELSSDTGSGASGGDLGWFGQGAMVAEFEAAAWELEIGAYSLPVESQFGWHVIQALGHEERPLSDSRYEQLRQDAFTEWLSAAVEAADVEIAEDWADFIPTEPSVVQ